MVKKFLYIFVLLTVLLVGTGLRLVKLDRYPNGFFRDEAALGYNAYSIWKTGRDEYGMKLPLVFRSFEVFFLPAYVYLSAPIVGTLGLNVFDTRLLSALSGMAALIGVWFVTQEMWGDRRLSVVATLFLAIAPWHILYSRGAFEGNLGLTLFLFGFLFWLRFIRSWKAGFSVLAVLCFGLSMYAYQAERLVVPLFGLIAVWISRKKIWGNRGKVVAASVLVTGLLLPLTVISFNAGGSYRAYNVSVLSKDQLPPGWLHGVRPGLLVNNEAYLRVRQFTSLYLAYLSPRNLFVEGDANRQRAVDGFSVFYTWMLPFLIVGLVDVVRKRSLEGKLLLTWLVLGPLPAAATSDPFHTYRALLTFLPLTILAARGLFVVWEKIGRLRKVAVVALFVVGFYAFGQFLFAYFVEDSFTRAEDWDYGYQALISYLGTVQGAKKIVIDDPKTTPYIQLLFFGKVDPRVYQKGIMRGTLDKYYTSTANLRPETLGNFEFRSVDWRRERGDSGKVFVMANFLLPPSEFVGDPNVKLLKVIDYPNGETAFRVVRIR